MKSSKIETKKNGCLQTTMGSGRRMVWYLQYPWECSVIFRRGTKKKGRMKELSGLLEDGGVWRERPGLLVIID